MDFEKICMVFTMREPYYGILLSAMNKVPTRAVPTLGVARNGNVFMLGYNPDFVSNLTLEQTLELLKHETLHLAFNHVGDFWDNVAANENEKKLRNYAEDMEVNGYLNINILKPLNPVEAPAFGWENRLGTREYFKRLKELMKNQNSNNNQNSKHKNSSQQSDDGGDSSKSGRDNQGDSQNQQQNSQQNNQNNSQSPKPTVNGYNEQTVLDDHSKWPNDEDSSELSTQLVEELLVNAAEEVEKSQGTIPSEMRIRLDNIRKKRKSRPVTDWRRYVRRYIGNEFTEFTIKSRRRESKRFPDAAGNRHRRKSHVMIAIDTSGSVSMPEYREFLNQIKTVYQHATFHVVECDSKIQFEYDFNGTIHQELHGGGGTSFKPVIDKYLKERKKYDALVYFTDGYCDVPSNTPQETLWVISSKGNSSDKNKFKVNGSSVVFIKPNM